MLGAVREWKRVRASLECGLERMNDLVTKTALTGEEGFGHYVAVVVPACQLKRHTFNTEGTTS